MWKAARLRRLRSRRSLQSKCQMEMVRAISTLHGNEATRELESLTFQPNKSFSPFEGVVAGFQLWDRAGADATPAVQALKSSNQQVADRAEWMLVKASQGFFRMCIRTFKARISKCAEGHADRNLAG